MSIFKPSYRFVNILEITPENLKNAGVKAALVDADNTLALHGSQEPFPGVSEWIRKTVGSGIPVIIISNNKRHINSIQEILSDKEKKLSFTKIEDVYKRSLQAAKKGKMFTFHWRGGYLTKTVLEELLELIQKAGEEKGKRAKISLNWSQAVIRFAFTEKIGQAEVVVEEANEGELE